MAWFKVDDHFWGHPKRLACSLSQIGLWVTAGSWSAQQLTDGHVPRHVLPTFGAKPKDAAGLVAAGLWLATDDGWQFHDWHLFQPSRADVLKTRDEAAARKKAWRDKRAAERAAERAGDVDVPVGHEQDTNAAPRPEHVAGTSQERDRPTYPDPDPTRPDPDPDRSSLREEQEDPTTSAAPAATKTKRATSVPDVWPPDSETAERLRAWAQENVPAVDLRFETSQWQDWHRAAGITRKDWSASWRNWMGREQKRVNAQGTRSSQLALVRSPRPSASDAAATAALEAGARVAARHAAREGA